MASVLVLTGYVVIALASIILLTFLTFCTYLYFLHRKHDYLPGPKRASFFSGHIPIFREEAKKGKEVVQVLQQWSLNYDGLFTVWFFHKFWVVIYSKEILKDALIKFNFRKPLRLEHDLGELFGVRFMKKGLVTVANHEEWKKKRQAANPAFYRSHLKTLIPDYNKSSEIFLNKMSEFADGKTEVSMLDYFHRVTLDVIGKVAFDLDLKSLEDDHTPFPSAVGKIFKGLTFRFRNPFFKFNPWTYSFQREVADSLKLLRKTGRKCIDKRRAAMERGETMPDDILSTMMKLLAIDSLGITDEDLLDDFLTFFIAGQETTGNQLSFMLATVTQHPDIMDKLLTEINDVLGSRDYVEFDDLAKLQYMGQVLKETLRLYPPAHTIVRATKDEVVLNGHVIPQNTDLMVSIYCSHHWPRHFEDPEKFDPDRWSPENADKIPHFAFLPFSTGPRNCIGQVFAQFESKVVMARFLKTFRVSLCPGQTCALKQYGTLQPKDGVMCTLEPR